MSEPLPPLNALRAFEATARNLSFTRAADELHVTPAALSHQIKGLEDFLGVKLFHRKPRAIELSDAGRTLYPGVHQGFGQLRQAVQSLERIRNDRVLVVSAPPGFTAKWLAPRLHRFLTANPNIDARISSTSLFAKFDADDVDVSIRNAVNPSQSDLHVEKLVDIALMPVASPRLIEQMGEVRGPADLLKATLIIDESLGHLPDVPDWRDWFSAHGVQDVEIQRPLRFNSTDHALEAAVEGAGVLLCPRTLAYDDLRTGRLVALYGDPINLSRAFWFVTPSGMEQRPKIKAFRDWMRGEFDDMIVNCKAMGLPDHARGTSAKAGAAFSRRSADDARARGTTAGAAAVKVVALRGPAA